MRFLEETRRVSMYVIKQPYFIVFICVYSGDLCDYEIDPSL